MIPQARFLIVAGTRVTTFRVTMKQSPSQKQRRFFRATLDPLPPLIPLLSNTNCVHMESDDSMDGQYALPAEDYVKTAALWLKHADRVLVCAGAGKLPFESD